MKEPPAFGTSNAYLPLHTCFCLQLYFRLAEVFFEYKFHIHLLISLLNRFPVLMREITRCLSRYGMNSHVLNSMDTSLFFISGRHQDFFEV